ncbi:MAG: protein kinase [Polyangiaceae bacterium]|nr:protein kinase [Polyangiaceae bacterium]
MTPGEVIADRFEIERLAGAGGMGVVYRALDRAQRNKPVALKVLLPDSGHDPSRFAREAQVLAEVNHPAIVGYVAHGTTPAGQAYLAMEWLDGVDLATLLAERPLTVPQTIALGVRIATALGAAHARGIVHRDLKPNNILLPGRELTLAKLLDFGIARVAAASNPTQTGTIMGTPGYMAPEQARGSRDVAAPADIFSLGCVLFECLTGRPPFTGDHPMAILVKIILDETPPIRSLAPHVPPQLEEIITRALSKEPQHRPPNGEAMAALLASVGVDATLIGAQPETVGLTSGEQKVLCVVLAMPHGKSVRPPAELGTVVMPTVERLAPVVAPFGAVAESITGGGVVATVSGEGTATDHAARAAGVALALNKVMSNATIAVATGRGRMGGTFPAGEVIDRAAALVNAGPPQDPLVDDPSVDSAGAAMFHRIAIDPITAGLLDVRFAVSRTPQGGFVLRGERPHAEGARTLLGRATPCVGRDRELSMLTGLYDECVAEPVGRGALILGAPGIGKSRLRYEVLLTLQKREPKPEIWAVRGDPMRAGSPFSLLGPLLARACDIHDGEPLVERQTKLIRRVERHLPQESALRVAELLGEIVGAPFPDETSVQLRAARKDPGLLRDQLTRAWVSFCTAEVNHRPLVLVLDDLHWGDSPSLSLIQASFQALLEKPIFILALGRPEAKETFFAFGRDLGLTELTLRELTKKSAEKLVKQVLGEGVEPATLDRVVTQAQGHALYLEELIRAVAEGRGDVLPETLVTITQSRLEQLDGQSRRILRAASLMGDVFWQGAVVALTASTQAPHLTEALLADLARREHITRRPPNESRFPGEIEYVFRHALVREAAYGMLTDEDREKGHKLAGEWLEQVGETQAASLAEHFFRAGISDKALRYLVRAAEQSVAASDLTGVLTLVERALTLHPTGETRGRILLARAKVERWKADAEAHERTAREATSLLAEGSAPWFEAVREWISAAGSLAQRPTIEQLAQKLVALSTETRWALGTLGASPRLGASPTRPAEAYGALVAALGRAAILLIHLGAGVQSGPLVEKMSEIILEHDLEDPVVEAGYQHARSVWQLYTGDLAASAASNERAIQGYLEMGDLPAVCMERSNLGNCYIELGAYDAAEAATREARATAERAGLSRAAFGSTINLGLALVGQGKLDEAISTLRDIADRLAKGGDLRYEAAARLYLAIALFTATRLPEAEIEAAKATLLGEPIPPLYAYALGVQARILLRQGDPTPGALLAQKAIHLVRSLGGVDSGEATIRLAYLESLTASRSWDEMSIEAPATHQWLLSRADKIKDPTARERFLTRVHENAAILGLTARWIS